MNKEMGIMEDTVMNIVIESVQTKLIPVIMIRVYMIIHRAKRGY